MNKKIIMREGLVIIGIITISALFSFAPIFSYKPEDSITKNYYKAKSEIKPSKAGVTTAPKDSGSAEAEGVGEKYLTPKELDAQNQKSQAKTTSIKLSSIKPRTTIKLSQIGAVPSAPKRRMKLSDIDPEGWLQAQKKRLEDQFQAEVNKEAESWDKKRRIGLVILLFAYPIYWLIRFIIWAIKSLPRRMTMNQKIIIGTVILIIGLAILFAQSNRYYLQGIGGGKAYKIDRWTGKTWLLHNFESYKVR